MLRRTGHVAVATVAAVVGVADDIDDVADNADDVLGFALFFFSGGLVYLICSFRLACFVLGP